MKKQYHILNGDVLKNQFPENIPGEIIVIRECLIDGSAEGNDLKNLFATRAKFISDSYEGCSEQDYFKKTVPEFQKIPNISQDADINLWFEDDLFCQVNLWFVTSLLEHYQMHNYAFLVRPKIHNEFGFGGLNQSELISVYDNRLRLVEIAKLSQLWKLYQKNETVGLLQIAEEVKNIYPFILPAVKAHIDRLPKDGDLGRPTNTLIKIMDKLQTEEFELIFREFNKCESIYGFGDLQVKQLFDKIKNNH